ncbi:MAG: prepilin-type N-terminal cleavage/methylation domain-containing protein [Candidatus Omnitrophica bacterium]|nr:prepilin-type N-terminal cleavage/methylation domain-containing protein [Candidatus Omnitrophota bacterium]MBU4479479.1 prepilin-type N-terminal cleavage/methylation domain-containing protein [Candidatus Omnitrophota bacterium]
MKLIRLAVKHAGNKAFTLIELLSVIVIISVLFALSVPVLTNTARNFYFKNKVKQIEALLKFVKKISIMEEKIYKITLNYEDNSYRVWLKSQGEPADFLLKSDSILGPRQLAAGFFLKKESIDKEMEEIIFNPAGTLSAAAFLLVDEKGHEARFSTTLSGEICVEFLQ